MSVATTRNIGADNLTEIAIDFTRPVYLVKMEFPSGVRLMSTGVEITFDGDAYIEGQVSVGTITWNDDGSQEGSITISNEANAASALILSGTVNDVPITIYKTYLIAAGGNTTPQVYLTGVMDGSSVTPKSARVNVVSTASSTTFLPNRYYTQIEGFNWLPIDGEIVTWGEEVFTLQAAN